VPHPYNLFQRVNHIHQSRPCRHDGVDVIVGHRHFVDDARILAAFYAFGRLAVILQREALPG
jgi:hypothetical protein